MGEHAVPDDDAPAVDLTSCDREPIHIPGRIQPHGVLLAFVEPALRPVSVSANVETFAGLPVNAVLGAPLAACMTGPSIARLEAVLAGDDPAAANPIAITLRAADGAREVDGILHRHDGLAILELEPRGEDPRPSSAFFRGIRAAIRRLQTAADLPQVCAIAAQEVRRITGFDRVKIYRFAADWTGQVIAEDRGGGIPSLYDFHFPASDIPAQSRALYTVNPVRIIPDIGYTPAPLVPDRNPLTGGPIDLSFSVLRSVSPVHVEYMVNMAVHGAMSVSIVREGRLWGLISCHHTLPRFVAYEVRQACELIAQVLTWQIAVLEEAAIVRHSVRVRAVQQRLLHGLGSRRDVNAGLVRGGDEMLSLMDAAGFALSGFDGVTTYGRTLSEPEITALVGWLSRSDSRDVFQTDCLGAAVPAIAADPARVSGVLAVPLGRASTYYMLWFRPEVAETVTWGGDPHKPVRIGPLGERLQTRASFDAWREVVRGRSRPWQPHEIVAAIDIRDLVVDVILSKAEELEGVNRQLARSNDELESFAYVASHDLKEPLRHIEAFAGLLKESLPKDPDGRLGAMVGGIETSSRRLRALINDLAEYSRVGRQARPLAAVPLDEVLADVLADLRPVLEETGASVSAVSLPVVMCDRSQIRQVLQNLISNAVKYRHPDRTPAVAVRGTVETGPTGEAERPAGAEPGRHVRITIADNGIGFDEKYREQIFEPFQRLHGPDEYEGTGIGLAICRKIVQRHGGSISATSTADTGATFTFTLPMRSLDDGDRA
ncbi:ATP-binding protein [Rhodoplanes sp. TEM]|uniref:histidine kinase n=1 Tax=Rhodoplanes tepidamans TaxID=200616 RepID=A0ABT5J6R5_RHOTP|nr:MULTISPECIES: ATP-binding protein [Rhodoplanes]MDC7784984.1 ATP-binding protein [Rhodoplanes tepidamans]MDC7985852.1 ATP-binding protein [Rhodoplanes sp. TEM]MDQ0353786.1 light-regulated signal transduction histidine kinase (bacteriophytochrome) [Rhodoplanes tepidamans]